jgi:Ion channel
MLLIHQLGAAFVLVMLTLWLQSGGMAALITWARRAVAGDIHKLGPLHIAVLVVRLTMALIALQGLQVLLWACCYRWLCFPSRESALYFSASSYATVGYGDIILPSKVAHAGSDREHSRSIDLWCIGKPSRCDRHAARRPREVTQLGSPVNL